MEKNTQVLELVNRRGPIIPSQISGEIGTDILLASAILSELASKKQIRVSKLKVGGTPLYYFPGQEEKLQEFIKYLNGKQREAYDLLKERRVLKDRALTPVIRVALREINDFAKPLEVTIGESKQIFWKWYLLGKEETESLIKEALGLSKKVEAPAPPPQHPAPKEKIPEKIVPEKPAPIQQKIPEKPKEAIKPEPVQEKLAPAKPKPAAKPKKQPAKASTLLNDTLNFFEKSGIEVLEQGVLKKNSEFEFVIKMPTPVGEVKYYCVAKSKKRCSDSDLSAAFAQGDMRKLPVLFISPGELTKKAAALLEKGLNITYKKI